MHSSIAGGMLIFFLLFFFQTNKLDLLARSVSIIQVGEVATKAHICTVHFTHTPLHSCFFFVPLCPFSLHTHFALVFSLSLFVSLPLPLCIICTHLLVFLSVYLSSTPFLLSHLPACKLAVTFLALSAVTGYLHSSFFSTRREK